MSPFVSLPHTSLPPHVWSDQKPSAHTWYPLLLDGEHCLALSSVHGVPVGDGLELEEDELLLLDGDEDDSDLLVDSLDFDSDGVLFEVDSSVDEFDVDSGLVEEEEEEGVGLGSWPVSLSLFSLSPSLAPLSLWRDEATS
ncbi:hypothetical protein GGF49_001000 [Coemansia sp. RSA 1853]|nr:hypothetical protein GGF49_001000 [Coemansia sp. RSA 1853]